MPAPDTILDRYPEYAPPAPIAYSPGPPPRGSYSGHRASAPYHPSPPPAPPPDIFAGYIGPAVDAAKQIVQQFLTNIGFPQGLDVNGLTLQILAAGLAGDVEAATMFLYHNGRGITEDIRNAHPNAQFGLDMASFVTRRDAIDSAFQALVGEDPREYSEGWGTDLQKLYFNALRYNWSQSQVLQHLLSDPGASAYEDDPIDPKHPGWRGKHLVSHLRFEGLLEAQPWLAAGQTYEQEAKAFHSLYGRAPVDLPTLASWFRFGTGTQQLAKGEREAVMSATPAPSQTTAR